jgi:hypothetical protein
MLGHRGLYGSTPVPPHIHGRVPRRMLFVGPATLLGRPPVLLLEPLHLGVCVIRSLLQRDKVIIQFDCHGRILGGRSDIPADRRSPLREKLLVPRLAGPARGDERPDLTVDLRERAHRATVRRGGGHVAQDIGRRSRGTTILAMALYEITYSIIPPGVGPDDYEPASLERRTDRFELPAAEPVGVSVDGALRTYGPAMELVHQVIEKHLDDGSTVIVAARDMRQI